MATALPTLPNLLWLLGIDPYAPWTPMQAEAALRAARDRWRVDATKPGEIGTLARGRLQELGTMQRQLAESAARNDAIAEAREHWSSWRQREQEADTEIAAMVAKGFVRESEARALVDAYGPVLGDLELQLALSAALDRVEAPEEANLRRSEAEMDVVSPRRQPPRPASPPSETPATTGVYRPRTGPAIPARPPVTGMRAWPKPPQGLPFWTLPTAGIGLVAVVLLAVFWHPFSHSSLPAAAPTVQTPTATVVPGKSAGSPITAIPVTTRTAPAATTGARRATTARQREKHQVRKAMKLFLKTWKQAIQQDRIGPIARYTGTELYATLATSLSSIRSYFSGRQTVVTFPHGAVKIGSIKITGNRATASVRWDGTITVVNGTLSEQVPTHYTYTLQRGARGRWLPIARGTG